MKELKQIREHNCKCGERADAIINGGEYVCERCFLIEKELNKQKNKRR